MASNKCMPQIFESELCDDRETPKVTLKESERYRRGDYALQISFFRGKVYLHLQDNNKGRQLSIPKNIFDVLWNIREDIKAATELTKNISGPPSPPMIFPPKKRKKKKKKVIPIESDDDDLLI